MLSYATVEPHALELLRRIMSEPMFSGMRLVGGTALALQYGHRSSVDLDLFGEMPDDSEAMTVCLSRMGDLHVVKCRDLIRVYFIDNVKVDFVDYSRYPWIDHAIVDDGLRLASPRDIAAMKINAAEGRGTKKDFVDIYFLLQHYSLSEMLDFYKRKYAAHSEFRALMSLTYFDDAEGQMMPKLNQAVKWEDVKEKLINSVIDYKRR